MILSIVQALKTPPSSKSRNNQTPITFGYWKLVIGHFSCPLLISYFALTFLMLSLNILLVNWTEGES